ncbi:MAG: VOC family protein [Pyrinomonadaceae bacterium]
MFRVHHVALSVSDIGRSIEFYKAFGFSLVGQYPSPEKKRNIAHLRLGEVILELFCYSISKQRPAPEDVSTRDLSTIGIKHFSLQVTSLQDALRKLEDIGCKCTSSQKGQTGMEYFFVEDPDGMWIEIVQDERVFSTSDMNN